MTVFNIIKYPNKILRKKTSIVEKFDFELKEIVRNMFETMYKYNGVGLAANQVGLDLSIVVVDISKNQKEPCSVLALINPKILFYSKQKEIAEEGCLSFPKYYEKIKRSKFIEVSYYDINGKKHTIKAYNLLARVLQHEIDHINGIDFVKRMSLFKKIKFYLLFFLGKVKF